MESWESKRTRIALDIGLSFGSLIQQWSDRQYGDIGEVCADYIQTHYQEILTKVIINSQNQYKIKVVNKKHIPTWFKELYPTPYSYTNLRSRSTFPRVVKSLTNLGAVFDQNEITLKTITLNQAAITEFAIKNIEPDIVIITNQILQSILIQIEDEARLDIQNDHYFVNIGQYSLTELIGRFRKHQMNIKKNHSDSYKRRAFLVFNNIIANYKEEPLIASKIILYGGNSFENKFAKIGRQSFPGLDNKVHKCLSRLLLTFVKWLAKGGQIKYKRIKNSKVIFNHAKHLRNITT